MNFILVLFLLVLCENNIQICLTKKYNISLASLETCKEYDINSNTGYSYSNFFHIPNLKNNKLANNERLHLKFYVMTSMDAHILLSVNSKPKLIDRVYEIVIGAGRNSFSTIRLYISRYRVSYNMDPNILSLFEPTPIEIVQTKNGTLFIYIPGYQDKPILNYTDVSPLDIKYISFSSFSNTAAKWFYDCKFDGFETEIVKEQRPLSARERIVSTIKNANLTYMPWKINTINFTFQIKSISLVSISNVLKTRLDLIMFWQDNRISWSQLEFEGIKRIVLPALDIWTPTPMAINGLKHTLLLETADKQFDVQSNGNISLLIKNIEILTWCTSSGQNWPFDNRKCDIQLGLYDANNSNNQQLVLKFDSLQKIAQQQVNMLSEWQLLEVSVANIVSENYERYTELLLPQLINNDISIGFVIEHNSQFYKNVFSMPLLASQILLLLSFLLHGYRRGALLLVVLVILFLGMMFITRHAPADYVPHILKAYEIVSLFAALCYVLHVVIIWLELYPPKQKVDIIMLVINNTALRCMLCMRFADATEFVDNQEHPWREVAKILGRTMLIIAMLMFAIMNITLMSYN